MAECLRASEHYLNIFKFIHLIFNVIVCVNKFKGSATLLLERHLFYDHNLWLYFYKLIIQILLDGGVW